MPPNDSGGGDSWADPLRLAQSLIRCPSVTPADAGALDVLETALEELGFLCWRVPFSEAGTPDIDNLYARLGTEGRNFCFAGHTDVVPVGQGWTVDPFGGEVIGGVLHGRGASDMKGAIACFVAAVARLKDLDSPVFGRGSISLLVTGDEEGPSINGTRKLLQWLAEHEETLDACLVGEPTNPTVLGEMMKIGRRGSLNGRLTVYGTQGHAAYPHLADNPILRLLRMLGGLIETPLDQGTAHFQPSTVTLTSIDVGNPATNVIPAEARAAFNIRFNDRHTEDGIASHLRSVFDAVGGDYDLDLVLSGEPFLTAPGPLSEVVRAAVRSVSGRDPEPSTSGGTSDARFIKDACPVVEFGLVGRSMHKADECVPLDDLESLTRIYQGILEGYFP